MKIPKPPRATADAERDARNAEALRSAREAAGIKQCDLADVLKVSRGTLCNYEAGRLAFPDETLKRMLAVVDSMAKIRAGRDYLAPVIDEGENVEAAAIAAKSAAEISEKLDRILSMLAELLKK